VPHIDLCHGVLCATYRLCHGVLCATYRLYVTVCCVPHIDCMSRCVVCHVYTVPSFRSNLLAISVGYINHHAVDGPICRSPDTTDTPSHSGRQISSYLLPLGCPVSHKMPYLQVLLSELFTMDNTDAAVENTEGFQWRRRFFFGGGGGISLPTQLL